MIKAFVKLIHVLSSNTAPGEIAHAVSCGVILGFLPKDNLMWYVLFVFIIFLRIQRSVLTLSLLVATLLTALLDPYFDELGVWVLTRKDLIPLYYKLLNIPFVAFTKFHNSVVMGSLIIGLLCYIPVYILTRLFIFVWRVFFASKMKNAKITKLVGQIMKQVPLLEKIAEMAMDV